jgi:hypothetical protein
MRFTIRDAGFIRDSTQNSEVLVSEFAEGEGRRIELIHGTDQPDPQEVALGLDTYSLSDERGATKHGALAGWQYSGNKLLLALTAEAARIFGVERYELTLDTTAEKQALITRGLSSILGHGLA